MRVRHALTTTPPPLFRSYKYAKSAQKATLGAGDLRRSNNAQTPNHKP